MRALENETHIEVLREFSSILLKTVERLSAEIAALKDQKATDQQQWLSHELEDQLHRLQKKFFGFGRESMTSSASKEGRLIGHEGQQTLALTGRPHAETSTSQADTASPRAVGATDERVAHDFLTPDLVAESIMRELPKNAGAEAWQKIKGLTEDTIEITVTERTYKRVIHSQAKYRLKEEYNTSDKEVIITAPGPVKVKPGMTYSVDFALSVVSDKYEYHIPLERQRRKMEMEGLTVDVKTLYSLCEAVAEHCQAILPGIRHDIQNDYAAVCLDETPWRILSDKTLGQIWVMSNRIGSYYQFEPTRSGKIAEEMLRGYDGAIITDAYGGYNRLSHKPTIRVQNCWAHARREFFERLDDFPDDCKRAITLIDELFSIEKEARNVEDIRQLRMTRSRPTIDQLRDFLYETKPKYLPSQGISKAINYCLNHWKGLTHFLTDSTVNISNNEAERALRHVVVGRKNFLGSQTINGADTAATLYTVIETAKKCSTHPHEYLKYLITERWHKREPLTPKGYADRKLGSNPAVNFPPRSEWRIEG